VPAVPTSTGDPRTHFGILRRSRRAISSRSCPTAVRNEVGRAECIGPADSCTRDGLRERDSRPVTAPRGPPRSRP